ncbi:hypothetical protein E4K10_45865 [Streptomyces sp. T1317-0309]|nr:hypothetical protein E4K10_45865 [Streptomyces sp. T1317-0309]
MAARERRRLRRTLTWDEDRAWQEGVADLLYKWGIRAVEGVDVVKIWADRHPLLPAPRSSRRARAAPERPARGRYRGLPLHAPHTDEMLEATLGNRSCLP